MLEGDLSLRSFHPDDLIGVFRGVEPVGHQAGVLVRSYERFMIGRGTDHQYRPPRASLSPRASRRIYVRRLKEGAFCTSAKRSEGYGGVAAWMTNPRSGL